MKQCSKCNLSKELTEFQKNIRYSGGYTARCLDCLRDAKHQDYWKDPVKRRKYHAVRAAKQHDIKAEFILQYLLNHPCVDCGENDPIVLEFDHVRGEKKFRLASGVRGTSYSLDRIRAEIAKCEVRCSNCHKRKTAITLGYYKVTALLRRLPLPSGTEIAFARILNQEQGCGSVVRIAPHLGHGPPISPA